MRSTLRRRFFLDLWHGLRFMWPVLSGLFSVMAGLGLAVGQLEGWHWGDGLYFAFVTGLTIGYGDFVPTTLFARILAIGIGFCGILLTGLVAAVGVQALQQALRQLQHGPPDAPGQHKEKTHGLRIP